MIDGFGGDAILERMGAFWLSLPPEAVRDLAEMQQFADRFVTFMEVNVSFDRDDIVTSVLMGKSLLLVEGLSGAALIDAKEYPSRSVGEPPDGKVLRGSHDGFIEAVVPNMALLRRRIRDPHLTMEGMKAGRRSHNDVVLCYLDDRVDQALLTELRQKLQNIDAKSLTMAQESVAEAIRPRQWYNPFPKVRYTERPDAAAACVMEGNIILMVDNSASVMILPTTFFDFTQEANDFYFPPLVGTYLRILRVTVFLISLVPDGELSGAAAGLAGFSLLSGAGGAVPAVPAAGGGISHRCAEAGLPEHAGHAGQLLLHAGSPDPGRFCRAGGLAGAGSAGVYGLRVRGGLCPAQL